jgi:hypothetical protein
MKASELIKILKQQPDREVRIEFTDHTDYTYQYNLTEEDVDLEGNKICDGMDDDEKLFDDEMNYIGGEVIILKMNLF